MVSKETDRISPVHSRTRRAWKRGPREDSSQTAQQTPYAFKKINLDTSSKKSPQKFWAQTVRTNIVEKDWWTYTRGIDSTSERSLNIH